VRVGMIGRLRRIRLVFKERGFGGFLGWEIYGFYGVYVMVCNDCDVL